MSASLYLGDFAQDKTVRVIFYTTVDGVPTAPSSALEAADIRIYKNGSNAQKTTTNGITMTSPFDSLTGCHLVEIDTSNDTGDGGFWATASDYIIVLEADETLGGVALGGVIGMFSSENRSALRPTVADRALDVSAGGEAGLDWANIGSPTTAQNLSATNIDVDQVVASVSGSVGSVTAGVTLAAAAIQAIWDALTAALTTVGSIGKLLVDNVNATVSSRATQTSVDTIDDFVDTEVAAIKVKTDQLTFTTANKVDSTIQAAGDFAQGAADKAWSTAARTLTAATNITSTGGTTVPQTGDSFARLGAPAGVSVSADIAAIEAQTDDIGVAGAGLTAVPWNATWDAEVESEVADALEATIADSIPADGTRPSVKQALYLLTQFMLEREVVSTTVTVKKADGASTLFTLTLNDATTPTSITRAT